MLKWKLRFFNNPWAKVYIHYTSSEGLEALHNSSNREKSNELFILRQHPFPPYIDRYKWLYECILAIFFFVIKEMHKVFEK